MGLTNTYKQSFVPAITIGESVTPFNGSNARLCVGDGSTPFDPSQTDLQGTNKYRKLVDTGYPVRNSNQLKFVATFGTSEANFTWNEWGVANHPTTGVLMNRKVASFGTKTSNQAWQLEVTVSIT